jgi:hypothetical protein
LLVAWMLNLSFRPTKKSRPVCKRPR